MFSLRWSMPPSPYERLVIGFVLSVIRQCWSAHEFFFDLFGRRLAALYDSLGYWFILIHYHPGNGITVSPSRAIDGRDFLIGKCRKVGQSRVVPNDGADSNAKCVAPSFVSSPVAR